jgi:ABC-2 type transport system ATP-binding protein
MLNIQNLSVAYGEKKVLQNLSANFELGLVHGIVGLNGSGKTTFFNALAQRIPFEEGQFLLNDKNLHYSQISFLETSSFFYSLLTGKEYLAIFSTDETVFKENELADLFQLPLNDLVENYSTGMKKKLAILGVLKQNRNIVLLDEPFNGLDLESNKILEMIILKLAQNGKTIFLSSHILEPMKAICSEIRLLENGKMDRVFTKEHFDEFELDLFSNLREKAGKIIEANF